MKKIFLLLLITGLLLSCNSKSVYDELDTNFPENRWLKTDVRTHEFTIPEGEENYNMVLHFSHVYGYQFASVPITIDITNPDQTNVVKTVNLQIKDDAGQELGDCAGDYCDLFHTFMANEALLPGNYQVKISQQFPGDFMPNVLGIGIKVVKVKKKK